jgi:NAD(P)-dependent dehydrogenase (short-subunit alcohol dehydrogenase family)
MVEAGRGGSIIHIASDAAHQGEPGNSGYSGAKAAVVNFARAAAAELAHHGIRVNTISPTCMEHNIWKYGVDYDGRERHQVQIPDFLRGIPLQRYCRASDVAYAAIYLASRESSFVTGFDVSLDGGARSKYWAWTPGDYAPPSIDEYQKSMAKTRYGEPNGGHKA